jgi:hypothetical protein
MPALPDPNGFPDQAGLMRRWEAIEIHTRSANRRRLAIEAMHKLGGERPANFYSLT